MWRWLQQVGRDAGSTFHRTFRGVATGGGTATAPERRLLSIGLLAACTMVGATLVVLAYARFDRGLPAPPPHPAATPRSFPDLTQPVREMPKRFPARTYLPRKSEGAASGSIRHHRFNPDIDLIPIYDSRVWWESEHDTNDTEDDHLFHYAMEEPMRRLIELVAAEGALLKVQDAYRAKKVHGQRSLHKQGRAVDLTAEGISLQRLAQLAWAAGFDWVYNEAPKRGGAHVHASVRADRPWLAAPSKGH